MATKAKQSKATRSVISRRSLTVLDDARRAGLLDGDKTEHLSFRAPRALVEAARRETGINSPTELGILALATLAQQNPVAEYLKRTSGALGLAHKLDC